MVTSCKNVALVDRYTSCKGLDISEWQADLLLHDLYQYCTRVQTGNNCRNECPQCQHKLLSIPLHCKPCEKQNCFYCTMQQLTRSLHCTEALLAVHDIVCYQQICHGDANNEHAYPYLHRKDREWVDLNFAGTSWFPKILFITYVLH